MEFMVMLSCVVNNSIWLKPRKKKAPFRYAKSRLSFFLYKKYQTCSGVHDSEKGVKAAYISRS